MVDRTVAELKSIGKAVTLALVSCMVLACSTYVAYSGPELPDAEVGTVNCYSRFYGVASESCLVRAIDGRGPDSLLRLFSNTSKLTPGRHWLNIEIDSYLIGPGYAACGFDLDVKAGHIYQIRAHSLKPEGGWLPKLSRGFFYGASLELDVTSLAEERETRRVTATCNPFKGRGPVCRQTSDCYPNPDIHCIQQEGESFGRCGIETR